MNIFEVTDYNQLEDLVEISKNLNKKIFILGEGSNVLLNEELNDYIIIKFVNNNIIIDDNLVIADSGVNFDGLIKKMLDKNLVGLEHFSLIPGNVGGITFMNIHYKNYYVSEFIEFIDVYKISTASYLRLSAKKLTLIYTKNIFKESSDYIIYQSRI